MPPVPKSLPGRSFGAKSGSPLERLTIMKSGKVDFVAKVAPRPTPFAAETDSPARKEDTVCVDLLEDMDACANKATKEVAKIIVAEAYSSAEEIKRLDYELVVLKRMDELQRVRVSLLEKNEHLKGEKDGLEASIAGGEAPDDVAAKSITAAEGVATEQARVAYSAVGVGVELCKVVSHWVGSRMPYLQKQTSPRNH
ncbi:hypothetical protein ACFX11_021969 [Malus domestica]